MQNFTHYIDIIISIYLTSLLLGAMLYVPYRVARRKLQGVPLGLTIAGCFLWPITVPVVLLWMAIKCLLVVPIMITFRFVVKSFTVSKPEIKTDKLANLNLPEHDRETVPFKIDPELIKILLEDKRK